jgi:MSHA biogenesis protein MshM
MYNTYYGLKEKPFGLTPDTGFYFQSQTHEEALKTLFVALKNGDGFIKLTGEVGTGKTLVLRKLLDLLGQSFQTVYIPNPYMNCQALLRAVSEELGVLDQVKAEDYLSAINQHLIGNAKARKPTVILLDEAQSLPVESLEAIRLLSNLETKKQKLVQIVLVGQPELDQKLMEHGIRQLQQRIVHSYRLDHLDQEGVARYIDHRLARAGYQGAVLFDGKIKKLIFRKSGGVPRLINLLCDKVLMLAFASGEFSVTNQHFKAACQDTSQLSLNRSGFQFLRNMG